MRHRFFFFLLLLWHSVSGQAVITTIAGTGGAGYTGDGGAATAARLFVPEKVCTDVSGNIYIAEPTYNHVVRRVDAATGIITTAIGTGAPGYSGDGGAATAAEIYWPYGVCVTSAGDVLVTDAYSHVVRKVDVATGIITTIAGTGFEGYAGDGGPASAAMLSVPQSIVADAAGNIYFTEYGNSVIRKIEAATGNISTVAGTGVHGLSPDGGMATASDLHHPDGLAVTSAGDIFVADVHAYRIRRIHATTGIITSVAGTTGVSGYAGDGGPATAATLYNPYGIDVDEDGNLFIADVSNHVIRKVSSAGIITTIAGTGIPGYSGDGGSPLAAQLWGASGVHCIDGGLLIADAGNSVIRRLDFTSGISPSSPGQIAAAAWFDVQRSNLHFLPTVLEGDYSVISANGAVLTHGSVPASGIIALQWLPAGIYVLQLHPVSAPAARLLFSKL